MFKFRLGETCKNVSLENMLILANKSYNKVYLEIEYYYFNEIFKKSFEMN